jgi:hypothetical protein
MYRSRSGPPRQDLSEQDDADLQDPRNVCRASGFVLTRLSDVTNGLLRYSPRLREKPAGVDQNSIRAAYREGATRCYLPRSAVIESTMPIGERTS